MSNMEDVRRFIIDLGDGMSVYLQPGGCAEIRQLSTNDDDDGLMHLCRWREQLPAIAGAILELEDRRRAETRAGEVARDRPAGQ